MKKIFTILALCVSTSVFSASATLEYADVDNVGKAGQSQVRLSVRTALTKNIVGDISITQTQTDGTNKLGTRLETGSTLSNTLGPVVSYTRVAIGEKYSNTDQFSYYSVETGVRVPLGQWRPFVGYRFRSAFDTANNDTTRTIRVGTTYALTKIDSIGIRLDRIRGDATQNVTAVSYTRTF
jgi:hypothetical protein